MDGLVDSIRTDRRVASRRVRLDGRLDVRLDVRLEKKDATGDDEDAIGERAHLSHVCAASAGRRRGAVDARASGAATATRADGASAEP